MHIVVININTIMKNQKYQKILNCYFTLQLYRLLGNPNHFFPELY